MTTPEPGPAEKLAELLEGATPQVRREITAWLLDSQRPPAPARPGPWLSATLTPHPSHLPHLDPPTDSATATVDQSWRLSGNLPAGTGSQMVTLRLPAERHARLRDWCHEHGFSMAAVVRGLVERFLEEQAPSI